MIKKIGVSELRPGMYVHDLNCSWAAHPLFPTRFRIRDEAEIAHLVELGIASVYIDTVIGDDAPDAIPAEEVQTSVEASLLRLAESHAGEGYGWTLPTREELASASKIHREAHRTIEELMADVRVGRHCELENIEPAIRSIVDSVFRNSGALLQLGGIRTRDQYTFSHSVNVSTLLTAFARTLKLNNDITRQISIGGMLHDIGKMRVPDAILNKPGKLTLEEFDEMKLHVRHGLDILSEASWIPPIALQVTGQHHERYDGSGYPNRLKAGQISQFGQMASIVDVYDAITSARVYHEPMPPAEAIRKLQEWSSQYFNDELVGHFIRSVGIYPLGTLVRLESGLLGVVIEQSDANLLTPAVRVVYDTRKKCRTEPRTLELSGSTADRIVGYESPERWGVTPSDHLMENLPY